MATTPDVDIEVLLDCVLAHKAKHVRLFLEAVDLPKSGAKDVLRDRLQEYLNAESSRAPRLIEYLDKIEGWGNQHVYLLKAPSSLCRDWRNEDHCREVAKRNRVLGLVNHSRPVVLPEKPTLATIQWTPGHARFVWTAKRVWFERRQDEDSEDSKSQMVYRAFERKTSRATLAFDWNLTTGDAMLLIQRLPTGTNYARVRDEMILWLKPYVDVASFETVRVSPAIGPIRLSGEVRERKVNLETVHGGKVSFTSPGKHHGVETDATLRRMEAAGQSDVQGSFGNFYWLPTATGTLEDELHVTIHKKDQRIGIFGERLETEVRYVHGRILTYC